MSAIRKQIRVRFAPSPTGSLHLGVARTALFNYLFVKHEGGKFILRIEDTDLKRSELRFERDILENLKWLGIEWDEFYRQSERTPIYSKYIEKLLNENRAYHCFCSPEELKLKRQEQMARGAAPKYNGKCQQLPRTEVEKRLAQGQPSIIRFKTDNGKIKFKDLIRGEIEFDANLIGDFSIAKNLATPLYNLAAVIDDFEMEISHVIRGEDHISNTPKQILLQKALGFYQPKYAHLPLILGPDKSKLSKRHGAVAVSDYKKQGYLPEALVNFMAFLGWNPDTEKEIFSMEELIKEFSLQKVQKAGAVFNIERLDYLNGVYIRQKSVNELAKLCQPYLPCLESNSKLERIVGLYQERLKKLSEIGELTDFFFKERLNYPKHLLRWKDMTDAEIKISLDKLEKILREIENERWQKENLAKVLMSEAEKIGDRGKLLWPLRVALTGKKASAGPIEIAEILGKEKTLKRLQEAQKLLAQQN